LARATTISDRQRALALIASVVGDTQAPVLLQAAAYEARAGISYVKGDWAAAAKDYARAYALSPQPGPVYRLALSKAALGQVAEAESVMVAAAENGIDASGVSYHRGLVLLSGGEYASALKHFQAALDSDSPNSSGWEASAMAGQVLCAQKLGYDNLAATHRRELARHYPGCLECRRLGGTVSATESDFADALDDRQSGQSRQSSPVAAPSVSDSKRSYTIQLGSFADSTNAARLHRRLRNHFSNVRIVTASVNGSTYHRVRLGVFASKWSAKRFAEDEVAAQGLTFSVVSE